MVTLSADLSTTFTRTNNRPARHTNVASAINSGKNTFAGRVKVIASAQTHAVPLIRPEHAVEHLILLGTIPAGERSNATIMQLGQGIPIVGAAPLANAVVPRKWVVSSNCFIQTIDDSDFFGI